MMPIGGGSFRHATAGFGKQRPKQRAPTGGVDFADLVATDRSML
jgi:hypothetical protein